MFFLRQKQIMINLAVMSYIWASCSFTLYMMAIYVKYISGNIFWNVMGCGIALVVACGVAGLVLKKFGIRISISMFFVLSFAGGFCILFSEIFSDFFMPIFIVAASCGVEAAFCVAYVANEKIFPILFAATAMGICNLFSRFLTILSAQVGELPPPIPMIVFIVQCVIGVIVI